MNDNLAGSDVRNGFNSLVATSYALGSLGFLCVLLRFFTKHTTRHLRVRLDDWLALGAMIVIIPSAFIVDFGLVRNGLGRDIWTLRAEQITDVLMYFHTLAWLYFLGTTLVKLTMISYYFQIFSGGKTQRVLWATFAFTSAWGIAFVLVAVFQCYPIDYFWLGWDGTRAGSCRDANAIAWSNAASNIGLDLWIMAVPLWKLRTMHLPWKEKIGVGLIFCVGAFVTVMSALRCHSLVNFARSKNSTADFYSICLWSTIELTIGVVCACLPSFWPLWKKFRHKTAVARQEQYSRSLPRDVDEIQPKGTVTAVEAQDVGTHSSGPGILVRSEYSVHSVPCAV